MAEIAGNRSDGVGVSGVILVSFVAIVSLVACDPVDPEQMRRNLHMPPEGFVGDSAIGKSKFSANCAKCHGQGGRGTRRGPPLVHSTYRPGHHVDMSFHLAVAGGVRQHHWHFGNMPPIPGLTPEDVGHIVTYIRKQQRAAGIR